MLTGEAELRGGYMATVCSFCSIFLQPKTLKSLLIKKEFQLLHVSFSNFDAFTLLFLTLWPQLPRPVQYVSQFAQRQDAVGLECAFELVFGSRQCSYHPRSGDRDGAHLPTPPTLKAESLAAPSTGSAESRPQGTHHLCGHGGVRACLFSSEDGMMLLRLLWELKEIIYGKCLQRIWCISACFCHLCFIINHSKPQWLKTMNYDFSWFSGPGIQAGLWAIFLLSAGVAHLATFSWRLSWAGR